MHYLPLFHFQIGDATQLPFGDNSIDRIITNMPWQMSDVAPFLTAGTANALTADTIDVLSAMKTTCDEFVKQNIGHLDFGFLALISGSGPFGTTLRLKNQDGTCGKQWFWM